MTVTPKQRKKIAQNSRLLLRVTKLVKAPTKAVESFLQPFGLASMLWGHICVFFDVERSSEEAQHIRQAIVIAFCAGWLAARGELKDADED